MTVFYILGGLLAAWAVIVTALGLANHDFPGSRERLVSALSVLFVVAAISSAIISSANEEEHGGEEHGEEPAALAR